MSIGIEPEISLSRSEAILQEGLGQTPAPPAVEPLSRLEVLLKQIIENQGPGTGTVMTYGGRVNTVNDLPTTGQPNQYYFVGLIDSDNFDEYVWAEVEGGTGHWDRLGSVSIVIDSQLSTTSQNPVQNAVITTRINGIESSFNIAVNDLTEVLNTKYDSDNIVTLTKAEYDALDSEKLYNDKFYVVPDAGVVDDDTVIYGWHVDPEESDPAAAVTYLKDAVGMTPAAMGSTAFNYGSWKDAFFMPKPCMLAFDGTVEYYLDPDDYTKKVDGTASDVDTSTTANAMMEWPLIWYKFEAGAQDGEGYFYCSNKKVDDSYKCWCNINSQNNVIEHFYTAIYNVTGTEKARSLSGVTLIPANGNGSTTGSTEETRAKANNTTSAVEWYLATYADRVLISALLILMSKSLNNQASYGRGMDSGSQTAKEAYVTGTLNDKGLFWGDTSNGNSAVKVFGMENFFGCVWQRIAGLIGTSNGYAYKLTYGTADGSTAEAYSSSSTGYLTAAGRPSSNGFVSKMSFGEHCMLPIVVSGSSSTYWAEYFYVGTGYAIVGGASNHGLNVGALYVGLDLGFGVSRWGLSGSLSCKPVKKNN